ncbi:MAG: 2-oxo acid dehydrogenase subunit E2 [Defluviicoccus sp.]|nr:2-oxo acid dehydrogenase subunit E2 [Defluviicoccus sp.]
MDVVMPQLGETVTEGTVVAWHKAAGDAVKANETLFEVSTDKVDTEVPAPADGVLSEILVEAGSTVPVGARLAVIAGAGADAAPEASAPAAAASEPPKGRGAISLDSVPRRDARGNPLSPAVRRLIAEHGLDVAEISGTGRGGRITRQDVEALVDGAPAAAELVPLSRMRRQIGEHMVRSKATSPHVLQAVEIDFHAVERARDRHGGAWKAREGFSLSYLPFVAYAACRAIPDFPYVNASIEAESLRIHREVHLGIAVDLGPGGLIAPIINQPQVAILSTDGVRRKPAVVETGGGEAIAIRPLGVLAHSFDHRAIDGAYSAGFLARLREILEATDWESALG